MDFLILLALAMDANRFQALYARETDPTLDLFLGDADWRGQWTAARSGRVDFRRFLAEQFAARMAAIGYLPAGQSGSVTYVLTLPAAYTQDMYAFTVTFTIQDGGPGGLPPAQDQRTPFIGVPDLSIAQVIVPPVVAGQKFTATLIINNGGLGAACNPSSCGGFYVDAFIDPATQPPSYPYVSDGYPYATVPPVAAGSTATVSIANIQFAPGQDFVLYFKVDNFNCSPSDGKDPCLPSHSLGGLVPEYNESNNVAGPIEVPHSVVYLPLLQKNRR